MRSGRPPPDPTAEFGEWQHGWQHYASSSLEFHFPVVLAQSSAADQAHLRSHSCPAAGEMLCGAPSGPEFTFEGPGLHKNHQKPREDTQRERDKKSETGSEKGTPTLRNPPFGAPPFGAVHSHSLPQPCLHSLTANARVPLPALSLNTPGTWAHWCVSLFSNTTLFFFFLSRKQ